MWCSATSRRGGTLKGVPQGLAIGPRPIPLRLLANRLRDYLARHERKFAEVGCTPEQVGAFSHAARKAVSCIRCPAFGPFRPASSLHWSTPPCPEHAPCLFAA